MININSLKAQNFLTIGPEVEFQFNHPGLTLISGENGSGKTTILSALEYNLKGAVKSIKKSSLMNWHTKSDLLTMSNLTVGNDTIEVIRGMNPDRFEILLNTEPLETGSTKKHSQKDLDDLLGGYDITLDIVSERRSDREVLSMKASDRRDYVNTVFGTEKFAVCQKVSEKMLKDVKPEKIRLDAEIDKLGFKIKLLQEKVEENASEKEARLEELCIEIEKLKKLSQSLNRLHRSIKIKLDDKIEETVKKQKSAVLKLERSKGSLEAKLSSLRSRDIEAEISALKCPECSYAEDPDKLIQIKRNHEENVNTTSSKLKEISEKLEKYSKILSENEKKLSEDKSHRDKLRETESEIRDNVRTMSTARKEIETLSKIEKVVEIEPLIKEKKSLENERAKIQKKIEILEYIRLDVCSEDGYKSHLLNAVFDSVNDEVADLIDMFGLIFSLVFDSNLMYTIWNDLGDEIEYTQLGKGHRRMMNIVSDLAFKRARRHQTNAYSNLIMFDEIDEGMSRENTQLLIDMINKFANVTGSSVYMITHCVGVEGDRTIRVNLENGFSTYTEE